MMKVSMYTDGSSLGNPGPGGFGTILHYYDTSNVLHEKEITKGYAHTTNNQMELMSVISGFEALNRPCEVSVYSDSKYVVDAFRQNWISGWLKSDFRRGKANEVKNIELWERLLKSIKPHKVEWNWVKGHAGHPLNERCDELARGSAQKYVKGN